MLNVFHEEWFREIWKMFMIKRYGGGQVGEHSFCSSPQVAFQLISLVKVEHAIHIFEE